MNLPVPATKIHIQKAASILTAGGIVAIPTETVYGLAVNPENDGAVARLYTLKNRPAFNPLIIHVAHLALAEQWAKMTPLARNLADHFWPGPLTLVLDLRTPRSHLALAGLKTVAIRIPSSTQALDLLKAFSGAIAAPSANRSETLSPTTAHHVFKSFAGGAGPDMILDGGPSAFGLESTILDARGDVPILLRPGSLSLDRVHDVCGNPVILPHDLDAPDTILSPGQMRRHYAPRIPVRLNASSAGKDEAFLAFGPGGHDEQSYPTLNLSKTGNITEAASNLFSMLHTLEESGAIAIAIAPIPNTGLGLAINDRLTRAARS